MNDNVILIGFMGSGKDTVGKLIAEITPYEFLSTDRLIELRENRTIPDIFKTSGEEYFRNIESRALKSIKDLNRTVIATGGGLVLKEENRKIISSMGKIVHLDARLSVLKKRLKNDSKRPLIQNRNNIKKLYEKRNNAYKFADISIETSGMTPEKIAEKIVEYCGISRIEEKKELKKMIVNSSSGKYPVFTGHGFLESDKLNEIISTINSGRTAVITNPTVGSLYLNKIKKLMKKNSTSINQIIIPDGEEFKNLDTASIIYDRLMDLNFNRGDLLIALGGGVIGDITGFIASTFKRGIPLIHIPTTLLSQVDSSIGGKTGLNHEKGKNMIGTFYSPRAVLTDIYFLKTLSRKEFRNGMAEVIKYGIINDAVLFEELENRKKDILSRKSSYLLEMVEKSINIKKDVVEKDEKEESGVREILNYGHTLGHLHEVEENYNKIKHGEAVAAGMAEEAELASSHGYLKENAVERIKKLLSDYDLPTGDISDTDKNKWMKMLAEDKKIRNEKIRIPIPESIGNVKVMEVEWKKYLS